MRPGITPPPHQPPPGTWLPSDGGVVLDRIIDDLARCVGNGERCAIVWDIDGTLVDTRPRMLASLHAYGRTDLTLGDLKGTAPSTGEVVASFGLDAQRFERIWDKVFWAPERLASDVTITATVAAMRRAKALGIRNVIMTGRNHLLGPASTIDLRNRGVPFDALMCKQAGTNTVEDKARRLESLMLEGTRVGAFVTDATHELIAVNARLGCGKVTGVLVVGADIRVSATPQLDAHVMHVAIAAR